MLSGQRSPPQALWRVLPLAALALSVAGLTACPPPEDKPEPPPAGCGSDRDCGGGSICDKEGDGDGIAAADDAEGVCLKINCISDDDCVDPVNEKCDARRGICLPRNLCDPGDPAACPTAGDKCIYEGGLPICRAPSAATACTLSPSPAYVLGGETIQIEGVGNSAGNKLVAQTSFTWTTSAGTISADGVLTAPATGNATVTGTTVNGAATCTTTVNVYAAPAATDQRVVVIDQATRLPIANVKVAAKIGGVTENAVTDATGAATFAGGVGATAVSVFPDDNQWHTLISPPDDVIIYTAPTPAADAEVDGIKGTFDFSKVHSNGDIRLGLAGTAINAAITDLNFGTIIGESVPTVINIQGLADNQEVALPEGLVIGLGDTDFKGTYSSINDKRGASVAWALAGEVRLSEIGGIIGQVAGDADDIQAGAILAAVLPFFAKFDHALATGLDFTPAARPDCATPGSLTCDPGFEEVTLTPNTLLALEANFDAPNLPCAPGGFSAPGACDIDLKKVTVGEGDNEVVTVSAGTCAAAEAGCENVSSYTSGAVIISGVVVPGIGLVPLGLSAGLDDTSEAGNVFDGVLEQAGDNVPPPGKLLLDYAPPHDGVEGNIYLTVAIALDINSITGADDLGASIITQVSRQLPKDGNTFAGNTFLESQGGAFTAGVAGGFTLTKKGDADFYRVNLDDEGEAEWNVWFPADEAGFQIADLPVATAVDIAPRTAHADIQAFGLGAGYDGETPADFDELFAFNGKDLDNLLYYLGAWSSESCKENGICDAN